MDYDVSLLTGAQVVEVTGVQDLANLAADAELVLNTFVLNSHRAIYRKLQSRGIDPTLLDNDEMLKDAIGYEAVGRFALGGYIGGVDAQAMLAMSDRCLADFRPIYTDSTDSPRRSNEGIPLVGHVDGKGLVFGGDNDGDPTKYFSDDTPSAY